MLLINSLVLYCTILMLFSRGGVGSKRRKFLMGLRGGGGGDWSRVFFPGAPSKIDEQAVDSFTYNRCFKAKIIVFIDVG